MTLPTTLYKYYPFEPNWLPDLLSGKKLRFSARSSFNDPFDSRPAIYSDPRDPQFRQEAMALYKQNGISHKERERMYQQSVMRTINKDGTLKPLDTSFAELMGIFSMGSSWSNMLLWSHYGDLHSGVCIGFSTAVDFFQLANKVEYQTSYPSMHWSKDRGDEIAKIFLIKQKCWEYEEEWRILKRTDSKENQAINAVRSKLAGLSSGPFLWEQNGPGFYSFDTNAIVEITAGLKHPDPKWLVSASKAAGLKIPIYQISNSSHSFNLKRQLINA